MNNSRKISSRSAASKNRRGGKIASPQHANLFDPAALLNHLPGMVYRCLGEDPWRVEFVNEGCLALTGHTARDFLAGKVLYGEIIHPEDRQLVSDEVTSAIRQNRVFEITYRIVDKQGQVKWVWERGGQVPGVAGQPAMLEGFITDITAMKSAEIRLCRNEEQLRFLMEGTAGQTGNSFFASLARCMAAALDVKYAFVGVFAEPDQSKIKSIAFWDGEHIRRDILCDVAGTPCEIVRKDFIHIFPRQVQSLFPAANLLSISQAESYCGVLLRNSAENPIGLLCVFDIKPMDEPETVLQIMRIFGARCESELERLHAQDRLEQFTEDLRRSNRDLESFASFASHDLQAPLRRIDFFARSIEKNRAPKDAEIADHLQRIRKSINRMQALTHNLLNFSRITYKSEPLQTVNLNDILRETLDDLEPQKAAGGGTIHTDPLPTLWGDPWQMQQMIHNLLSNALKFRRPGTAPEIRIASRRIPETEQWEIRVQDNGIGIAPQYHEKIFQPFERLHGESDYEGSGIGLAICRKIALRHGGTITVQSTPGHGATFYIRLPVATGSALAPAQSIISRLQPESRDNP